jgi:hypothetical protein
MRKGRGANRRNESIGPTASPEQGIVYNLDLAGLPGNVLLVGAVTNLGAWRLGIPPRRSETKSGMMWTCAGRLDALQGPKASDCGPFGAGWGNGRNTGRLFVAMYNYALLMALADICVEQGQDDDGPLEVSTRRIAEKFIQYYWRQSMPFAPQADPAQEQVLRQNTGNQAGIIKAVLAARNHYNGSIVEACRDERNWRLLVSRADKVVREMPLWKLQTVGGERLDFLYENTGSGTHITLKPGVPCCFRKHYPLIADLVKGAWARYVRRFNIQLLGTTSDMHEFLFGSERASLAAVKPILLEFQKGDCFYCHRPLREESAHVDHFIPWSRYPVDLGHNFVLAHATCNSQKSDWVACANHLNAWVAQAESFAPEMAREYDRNGVRNDFATSVRIVNWAYTQTFECRGLTWVQSDQLEPLPPEWAQPLSELLN